MKRAGLLFGLLVHAVVASAAAPSAPRNVAQSVSGSTVVVTWAAPATGAAAAYVLEAGSSPGASDVVVYNTGNAQLQLVATSVPAGIYYVRLRAVNAEGASAASNEVVVTVAGPCMTAPQAPSAFSHTVSGSLVSMAWLPPPGGCAPAGYLITAGASPGAGNLAALPLPATPSLAVNAPTGIYYVRVFATNAFGMSGPSNELGIVVDPGETPPVLSVPIVDLSGVYDPVTRRLGSLNCTFVFPTDPNDRWCFNAFGISVVTGRQNVSYDFKVAANTPVVAATAGVVARIDAETNPLYPGEFEVGTRSSAGSAYEVIYDHVKGLQVAVGSVVSPGSVLGTAGIHTTNPAVYGRVELQINRITQRTPVIRSISLCPRAFGTESFNRLHDSALAAHNQANPAFQSASVCLVQSLDR